MHALAYLNRVDELGPPLAAITLGLGAASWAAAALWHHFRVGRRLTKADVNPVARAEAIVAAAARRRQSPEPGVSPWRAS